MTNQLHVERRERRLASLCLVTVVAIVALRSPWSGSFWLDETISAWIVEGSLADAVRRATDFQGQSPLYYILLWATASVLGHSEAALRALSVVCGGAALVAVFCLVRAMTGQRVAALVAVASLLCSETFQSALLSARPYALGILFCVLSMLLLEKLMRQSSRSTEALFTLSCVGAFYSHYLFAVICLAHCWNLLRRPELARRMLGWGVLGTVLALPALPQLVSLFGRRAALMFAQPLDLTSLFSGTLPVPVVAPAVLGVALGVVWGGKVLRSPRLSEGAAFMLPYIVVPAMVFALWSLGGSRSMWVPRYWGWQAVAWAALVGVLLSSLHGERGRSIAIAGAFAFCALRLGSQVRVIEDWRGAAEAVKAATGPVALYSGLVEVETGASDKAPEFDQYVRAPLLVYGVTVPIEPISLVRLNSDLSELSPTTASFVVLNRKLGESGTSGELVITRAGAIGLTLEAIKRDGIVSAYTVRR